jgi:hypothetical protein
MNLKALRNGMGLEIITVLDHWSEALGGVSIVVIRKYGVDPGADMEKIGSDRVAADGPAGTIDRVK